MAGTYYEWDVFFSYHYDKLIIGWISEVVSRLEFWLTQELAGAKSRIFFNRDSIEVGDIWPDSLRSALKTSRCMVSLWSPSYFQSRWCLTEWQSFPERERKLGLGAHGLIAPVRYHDGEYFPEEAAKVQWADFSNYTTTVSAFWASQRAVEFDQKLRVFAASVAVVVSRTPPFRADWPIVEQQPWTPGSTCRPRCSCTMTDHWREASSALCAPPSISTFSAPRRATPRPTE